MENRKSFGDRVEAFFVGKGFYIVLFLCVAVIGFAAWATLTEENETNVDSFTAESVPEASSTDIVRPEHHMTETIIPPETEPETVETMAEPEILPEAVPTIADTLPMYFVWPVIGNIDHGYSVDALAYDRTMMDWRTHDGVDIECEKGTQVKALADGIVAEIYDDERYGTTVVLSHGGGLSSVYSNLAAVPTVSVGDMVLIGQVIGSVGSTALCEAGEADHLHLAVSLNGASVDPMDYLH